MLSFLFISLLILTFYYIFSSQKRKTIAPFIFSVEQHNYKGSKIENLNIEDEREHCVEIFTILIMIRYNIRKHFNEKIKKRTYKKKYSDFFGENLHIECRFPKDKKYWESVISDSLENDIKGETSCVTSFLFNISTVGLRPLTKSSFLKFEREIFIDLVNYNFIYQIITKSICCKEGKYYIDLFPVMRKTNGLGPWVYAPFIEGLSACNEIDPHRKYTFFLILKGQEQQKEIRCDLYDVLTFIFKNKHLIRSNGYNEGFSEQTQEQKDLQVNGIEEYLKKHYLVSRKQVTLDFLL